MSERLRFDKARQVVEAYPRILEDLGLEPAAAPSVEFARKLLAGGHGFDAVAYVACLLARREAVWWGCQCVRALGEGNVDAALLAAEAWVREPDDGSRRAALKLGTAGNLRVATTWLALAAGHSGGSVAPEEAPPVPASPEASAVDVKAAIILASVKKALADQSAWIGACVEAGLRFAEGGESKVLAPKSGAASQRGL